MTENTPTTDSFADDIFVTGGSGKAFQKRTGIDIYALRIGNIIEPNEYHRFKEFCDSPKVRLRNLFNYIDARDLAQAIELCIKNDVKGIIHWGDSDHVSRYDFALMIAEKYSLNTSLISPILTEELSQEADRPLQSGLITDKIVKMLNVIPPSIDDCLTAILEKDK